MKIEYSVTDCFAHCTRWAVHWDARPRFGAVLLHAPWRLTPVPGSGLEAPTVEMHELITYARAEGFGGVEVRFAFSWMCGHSDEIHWAALGPDTAVHEDNDAALRGLAGDALGVPKIMVGWSYWLGDHPREEARVLRALAPARERLFAVAYSDLGDPRPPLYLRHTPLVPYVPRQWFAT